MAWYLETSAFLKLVVAEEHSSAMRSWFTRSGDCWSSQLLSTEALRAAGRLAIDPRNVEDVLDAITLVLPAESTFRLAARVGPPTLRSLDALHLASALELSPDLQGIVTYDDRIIGAAGAASVLVVSPMGRKGRRVSS